MLRWHSKSANFIPCAWFSAAHDSPSVYAAFSDDAGRSFGEPIRIDGGEPLGRVDLVLLDDGSALVTWLEGKSEKAELRVRRVSSDRALDAPFRAAVTSGSRHSGFPRLARLGDGAVLAWTQLTDDVPSVRVGVLH